MIGSPLEMARMEDQPVRKDRLWLLRSQATSRFEKSRSAGNRSRSRYGTVSAIGLRWLLFNGIGANWELAKPFLEALAHTTAIIFDVPGVGGSPVPSVPYRPSTLARLAAGLVAELGHSEIDVAGVSWGGGVAQQFAHQYPKLCRRLVLAATSPGA